MELWCWDLPLVNFRVFTNARLYENRHNNTTVQLQHYIQGTRPQRANPCEICFIKSEEVNSNLAVINYSPGEKKIDLKKRMLNEYKALSRFCCGAHLYPLQTQYADQLLVGLLTQLVERCTGIAEDMGSNPVQAWIFFRLYFPYCLTSVHHCEDRFHIHMQT